MNNIFEKFESNVFSAMIEFHQGAPLLTIWSKNSLSISENIENFLYYVGNTHIIETNNDIITPPIITNSSFNGIPYFSITTQIPDVNARGFSRIVNLIVAHQNFKPIVNQELIDIMNHFQNNALQIFLEEIPSFFVTILKLYQEVSHEELKKSVLESMINEIKPILQKFNIDTSDAQENDFYTLENIFILNNELRSINNLIKFDENLEKLQQAINHVSLNYYFPLLNTDKEIDFGTASLSTSLFLENISKEVPIIDIIQNDVFGHLVFSVLSGYKVLIFFDHHTNSMNNFIQDPHLPIDLTEYLMNFIPMYNTSKIIIFESYEQFHQYDLESSLAQIIIIYNKESNNTNQKNHFFIDEKHMKSRISILNLNEGIYQGLVCGPRSFVWQFIKINISRFNHENFGSFISRSYYQLKNYSDTFFRVAASFAISEFKNQHQFMSMLRSDNLYNDDIPMFYHWLQMVPAYNNISKYLECPLIINNVGTLSFQI